MEEKEVIEECLSEDEQALLSPEELEARRLEKKPCLDHLERATERKNFEILALFGNNVRLVVETRSSLAAGVLSENWPKEKDLPWLNTKVIIVRELNLETGAIRAWDEDRDHWVHANFKNPTQAFYFAPPFPANPFKDKRKKKTNKRLKELRRRMNDVG